MSDEDDQRWRNLMLFKMYATDKEIADMGPWLLGAVVVIVILFIIGFCIWG